MTITSSNFKSMSSLAACLSEADRISLKRVLSGVAPDQSEESGWMFSLVSSMSTDDRQAFAYALENSPLPAGGQGGGGGGGGGYTEPKPETMDKQHGAVPQPTGLS